VIERLLAGERALAADQLEVAQRLFAQVAGADPRNAIALTGLAKVAVRRRDLATARLHVTHALAIDPEDAAAKALAADLGVDVTEPATPAVVAETPAEPTPAAAPAPPTPRPGPRPAANATRPTAGGSGARSSPKKPASKKAAPKKAAPKKRGLLVRLLRAFLGQD
jgi:hypothetical protein